MNVKILNNDKFVDEVTIEFHCRKCKKFIDDVHVSSLGYIICTNCKTVVAMISE